MKGWYQLFMTTSFPFAVQIIDDKGRSGYYPGNRITIYDCINGRSYPYRHNNLYNTKQACTAHCYDKRTTTSLIPLKVPDNTSINTKKI